MKKISAAIAISGLLSAANLTTAQTLEATYPLGGGNISVTALGGNVNAAGLDFVSAGGNLIPVPGGPAASAAPFTFFLANTPNQITYGNLGTTVLFANGTTTELSAGYNGPAGDDFTFNWGAGGTPPTFPVCPLAGNPVTASPVRGSTLDFGLIARSNVSAFRLTDAIEITRCHTGTAPELTHFEISGASVFDVPDFAPVIFSDDQPDVRFDLVLDVGAPPGRYEAELSIFGDFLSTDPITYSLTAQIVPEPSSQFFVGLTWLILLTTCRRLKAE